MRQVTDPVTNIIPGIVTVVRGVQDSGQPDLAEKVGHCIAIYWVISFSGLLFHVVGRHLCWTDANWQWTAALGVRGRNKRRGSEGRLIFAWFTWTVLTVLLPFIGFVHRSMRAHYDLRIADRRDFLYGTFDNGTL